MPFNTKREMTLCRQYSHDDINILRHLLINKSVNKNYSIQNSLYTVGKIQCHKS